MWNATTYVISPKYFTTHDWYWMATITLQESDHVIFSTYLDVTSAHNPRLRESLWHGNLAIWWCLPGNWHAWWDDTTLWNTWTISRFHHAAITAGKCLPIGLSKGDVNDLWKTMKIPTGQHRMRRVFVSIFVSPAIQPAIQPIRDRISCHTDSSTSSRRRLWSSLQNTHTYRYAINKPNSRIEGNDISTANLHQTFIFIPI